MADGAARQAAWVLAGSAQPPVWELGGSAVFEAAAVPGLRERYADAAAKHLSR